MIGRQPVLLLAFFASGCVSYRPAPIDPAVIAEARAASQFDPAPVQAELARLAPQAAWDGVNWDRLALFAAALRANPQVAQARAHVDSAVAAARAARAGPSMTLTLTAEYARDATESSPWLYGLTSDVPLDIGARRAGRIDTARFASIGARCDLAEAIWTARMTLRRSLAEILLTRREIAVDETLGALRERQLAALERRVGAGEASRSELERVRGEAAVDVRRLSDAQARLLAAEAQLAEILGVSPQALDAVTLRWDDFDDPHAPNDAALQESSQTFLLTRADVLGAVSAYDQSEAALRTEVARQAPEVHLGPGYTWERGLVKLPFTLGLVLPPLDLNRSNIAAAEAQRAEAGRHLEAVISGAQSALSAALAERDAARSALMHQRAAELPAARYAAQQADNEIANGAIDRVDWAAAQVNLKLVELAEIDALRRVHAADAALEDALRRPLEGPELAIAGPLHAGEPK